MKMMDVGSKVVVGRDRVACLNLSNHASMWTHALTTPCETAFVRLARDSACLLCPRRSQGVREQNSLYDTMSYQFRVYALDVTSVYRSSFVDT